MPKKREVVLILGYPGSGKTSITAEFKDYARLNRDERGGKLSDLAAVLDNELAKSKRSVVLDNTFPTVESRRLIIAAAKKHKVPVRCIHLDTSIEDAEVNVAMRMVARHGKLLMPDEIALHSKKDPNMFPPAVLFRYKKLFEEPTTKEGFADVEEREFVRIIDPAYTGKAILLDYDGTIRDTISGAKYPTDPKDVRILPGRTDTLKRYRKLGYKLFGISNQGDVGRGKVTDAAVLECFKRTNELLGLDIEVRYCPHNPAPIQCYCRKPMPGFGVELIELHKLDRNAVIMVGDRTTDKTFARRCGIRYVDQAEFFT